MYKRIELEPTVPETYLTVEEVYSTYAYFYSSNYVFAGECHEPWELIYANSGEAVIETPEYSQTISKGQVFLHIPNEPHKIRANNTSCNMYFISFKCACAQLYKVAQKPITIPSSLKNYILAIVDEGLSYLAGKNCIPKKSTPPEPAAGQRIKNLIELLLIELIRIHARLNAPDEPQSNTLTEQSIVDRIIAYMQENIQTRLRLEEIALYVGYSVPRICAVFKKTTGMTIITYFTKMRIEKAKQLMAEKDMSVRQISEYLDFDTVQYFSSRFKKVTGLSPAQYIAYLKSRNYQFDGADNLKFL